MDIATNINASPAYNFHRHDPIAYSVNDAIRVSSIGRSRLYELMNSGTLESVSVGKRRLIKASSLRRLLGEAS
jgi:hypothetical protein